MAFAEYKLQIKEKRLEINFSAKIYKIQRTKKVNKGENKMKKLIIILTLIAMAIIPAISFAGDYWNETPDLNHNIKSEFLLNEAIIFSHSTLQFDMWAETPDMNSSEKKLEADQGIHNISYGVLNQEMYNETPDLKVAS
jgi:hypothetical protein